MFVDVYRVIVGFFCSPSYYHIGFVGTHTLGAHDVQLHIAGNNEPKSDQQAKQGV